MQDQPSGGAAAPSQRIDLGTIKSGPMLNPGPSLADVMAWEALSDRVRALARLVLLGGGDADAASLYEAYKAGFEDGSDAMREEMERAVGTPQPDRRDFEQWMADRVTRAKP